MNVTISNETDYLNEPFTALDMKINDFKRIISLYKYNEQNKGTTTNGSVDAGHHQLAIPKS